MGTFGAIFRLTLLGLLRSRFFVSLAALTLGAVLLLPLAIRDDGTLLGHAQILLRYTLVAVTFLLSVATLGVAPSLVAGELEKRRLQQVLVKPAPFLGVWAAKWAGLVMVNAVVLGAALLLVQARVFSLADAPLPAQAEALERTLFAPRDNRAPDPGGSLTVPPGESRRWRFSGVPKIEASVPLTLRVQFMAPSLQESKELAGEWTVGAPGAAPFFHAESRLRGVVAQEIVVPAPPGPLPGTLEVEFVNREAQPILFRPGEGLRLLVPVGTFGPNLFRAYLLILFKLSLLAAIGLAMGSLFSTPVAVLTAFFTLVLFAFSGYIGSVARTGVFYTPHHHESGSGVEHDEEEGPGWLAAHLAPLLKAAYRGGDRVLGPVRRLDPLERVSGGETIAWSEVGRGFGVLVVLGAGLMAGLAAGVFRRREMG